MKLFRRAVAVVGTALLIAFAGSAPAFASTDLHQVPPIEATQSSECQPGDVADGFTLWHFVLTQTEATQSSITVTFGYPATTHQFLSSKNTGGVLHFNVVRPTGKVLLGAYTAADGDLLNLSHTCIGGTTSTPTPDPTPTPEPTPSPEPSATPTPTPSPTPSPVASPTPTSTPSPTPSPTPSASPSPSSTPSATPSPVPSTEPLPSTTPVAPDMTLPPTDTAATEDAGGFDWAIFLITFAFSFLIVYTTLTGTYGRRR